MASKFIYLPKEELRYLSTLASDISETDRGVYEEQLDSIHEISLKNLDVMYLQYFKNIQTIVIDGFPDIENFYYISRYCSNISNLIVKNQPRLQTIDLTNFNNLKNLTIVSNEKLESIEGLSEELLDNLNTLEFYDNNNYAGIEELIDLLKKSKKLKDIKIDALYYSDFVEKDSDDIVNNIWHEKIGFMEQRDINYSSGEMSVAYNYAKKVIDTIIKEKDSDNTKIAVIYTWIIRNIKLSSERKVDLNEGIVNVFRYRECSIPTMAKFFQFLLRIAGIKSFDINVLPRVEFSSSSYGTFRIPSNDYEIIKINTNEGERYFDIVWDYTITKKIGDEQSVLFMFNGLDDILVNHKLIFDKVDSKTNSMSFNERKDYVEKALKRLDEVKEMNLEKAAASYDDIVKDILDEKQDEFEKYYKSIMNYKKNKKKEVLNTTLMDQAIEYSNKLLQDTVTSFQTEALNQIKKENLAFIEDRIGMKVSLYKNVVIEGHLEEKIKTIDELKKELKKFSNVINREFTNKEISLSEFNYMKSKADEIYFMLISMACDNSFILEPEVDV